MVGQINKDTTAIKDQLGALPSITTVGVWEYFEDMWIEEQSTVFTRTWIYDSFILGHNVNGLLGEGVVLENFESGADANWTESAGITDNDNAVTFQVGSGSLQIVFGSTGSQTLSTAQVFGDLSAYTGVANGTPSKGTCGVWWNSPNTTGISALKLRIGSSASDYVECSAKEYTTAATDYYSGGTIVFGLFSGWNYYLFDLDSPDSTVGTPDWTNADYARFEWTVVGAHTGYLDYFTISKSNFIGLNGLGDRKSSSRIVQVINPSNTYHERFRSTDFKASTTTANWSTVTYNLTFVAGQTARSEIIALNGTVYTKATFSVTGTTTTNLTPLISFDNGSNWETAVFDVPLTAANPSSSGIMWRLDASGNSTVTSIKIVYE